MQSKEGLFNGVADLGLYYQSWLPDHAARAVVVIIHGFSDHCGRYDNLVEVLVNHRLAVYSYDLRGHGQSSGKPGYVDRFDDYRQDTHIFINLVHKQHPNLPLFLFGHSMGGLIALDQALYYPESMSGVIASAPHLGTPPVAPVKLMAGRVLSRLWPSFSMPAGLDESGLSRDEEAVQAYRDDPLVHGVGTARLSTEIEAAVAETQTNAQGLKPPLFIYFGSEDHITNPADSQRFYDSVLNTDKTIIIYDGGHHENHNDIHYERVVIEVAQWIEAQLLMASQQPEQQDSVDG